MAKNRFVGLFVGKFANPCIEVGFNKAEETSFLYVIALQYGGSLPLSLVVVGYYHSFPSFEVKVCFALFCMTV